MLTCQHRPFRTWVKGNIASKRRRSGAGRNPERRSLDSGFRRKGDGSFVGSSNYGRTNRAAKICFGALKFCRLRVPRRPLGNVIGGSRLPEPCRAEHFHPVIQRSQQLLSVWNESTPFPGVLFRPEEVHLRSTVRPLIGWRANGRGCVAIYARRASGKHLAVFHIQGH